MRSDHREHIFIGPILYKNIFGEGFLEKFWQLLKVAVVVPIYRNPTLLEQASLACLRRVLGHYPIYFACPKSLSIPWRWATFKKFSNEFFTSARTYAALMVSPAFYQAFDGFDYILIYQLDCMVFRDELAFWCDKKYDYVAPPFLHQYPGRWPASDCVGFGGFSLRKVKACLEPLAQLERFPEGRRLLDLRMKKNGAEDVFWGVTAARIWPDRVVSSVQDAAHFGFDGDPRPFVKKYGEIVPFGYHHCWNFRALYYFWPHLPFRGFARIGWLTLMVSCLAWQSIRIGLSSYIRRMTLVASGR